jgi:hypothetical protein
VAHTKEEFVMDFVLLATEEAVLTARVITSPAHMKRILAAVKHNVELYERNNGPIQEDETTPPGDFGMPTKH